MACGGLLPVQRKRGKGCLTFRGRAGAGGGGGGFATAGPDGGASERGGPPILFTFMIDAKLVQGPSSHPHPHFPQNSYRAVPG